MKKVVLIFSVLLFSAISLTGCTDLSREAEEIQNETKLESDREKDFNSRTQSIDKKDVEPGTRG